LVQTLKTNRYSKVLTTIVVI